MYTYPKTVIEEAVHDGIHKTVGHGDPMTDEVDVAKWGVVLSEV